MKNRIQFLYLCACLFIAAPYGYTQTIHTDQAAAKLFPDAKLVRESLNSELPSFIRFQEDKQPLTGQFTTWMKNAMKLGSDYGFNVLKIEEDQIGFTHTRLIQTYKNYPIETAIWLMHAKENKIQSMNGLIYGDLNVNTSIGISEAEALENAKAHVGAASYKWELEEEEEHLKWESNDEGATYFPIGELVLVSKNFSLSAASYRLAYKFNIYAHEPVSRAYIYVDAQTGEIIAENSIIHHVDTPGTAVTVYSGVQPIIADSFAGQYRLRDGSRGLGVRTFDLNNGVSYGAAVDFVDADNNWNNVNPQQDEYAGDTHWGTELCYDYYNIVHGRNSIDNAGFQLNSYIHYSTGYVNAFWDGSRMTYGDGNGAPYTPLTSVDIAGHELTHGLTNFTANLVYAAESGALNESFSDIFGTAIENYGRPGDWDWLMSDDIGAPFRNLSNPNAFGHPDTYFGTFWAPLAGPDNGGVHSNSGVQNYWYYLLVSGGTGVNDIGDAFNVTGIGFTSANAIAFRNLTVYLTPGSNHSDARFYAIQSAIDLFGECSVEEEETTNAWYAVGVGPEYVSVVEADFTATIGCFPDGVVDFTDASTTGAGVLASWDWDFGDGGTAAVANPTHTFAGTGTYPVELTVTNDLGCENMFSLDISVFDAPNVSFTSADFCEGGITTFTDATTIPLGSITAWDWDFGDATTSGLTNPTHTFGAFGVFDIKLVATSDNGCKDSLTIPITIEPGPLADFTFTDICPGIDATFVNISTSPDGAILTDFVWDFGDGSPTVTTTSPTHTYPGPGAYNVTLDVISDEGCNGTVTYTINQYNSPFVDFGFTTICQDEIANFVDFSTIIAPETIASLSWDFGDGTTGVGGTPSHSFGSSGTFNVTLTATSANGCSNNLTLPFSVFPVPIANFSATNVCINGLPTAFDNLSSVSSGSIVSWDWTFGDGSGGSSENPTKKYLSDGTYSVDLTVVTDNGCDASFSMPVNVYEKPNANFTSDLTSICSPDCISFTSLSSSATAGISNWQWEIENGETSFSENPKICFSTDFTDQLYDVELIVTNDFGCKDTLTVFDYVSLTATPIAEFTFSPREIDILDTEVHFTNESINGVDFTWNFGDNSAYSTSSDPFHTYPQLPATYTVLLEAVSANGLCKSYAEEQLIINDVIIYYMPNAFTPDGDTYNEIFAPVFRSGYDPYDFHFVIYNRWGEVVFESFNAGFGWNGTYGDQGLVEDGTYVWRLEFRESMTDKRHEAFGSITIIK